MICRLIWFLLIGVQLAFTGVSNSVAILDFFEIDESNKKRLSTMSNIFEVELKTKNVFTILDRSAFQSILTENQMFQYRMCDSIQCQIEIGRMLGIEKIITGTLLNFDEFYSLTIEIIEVETGFTEKAFAVEIARTQSSAVIVGCKRGASLVAQYAIATTPSDFKPMVITNSELAVKMEQPLNVVPIKSSAESSKNKIVEFGLYALAAVSVGTAYYFDLEVTEAYDEYNDYSYNKSQDELDRQWDTVQKGELKRNVFYGIGAALFVGGISYTLFF